jgi:beta-glucanase (GH16 family)
MLKRQSLIAFIFLFHLSLYAQQGVNSRKWELVWEDSFDFFDTTIWTPRDNFDHYGGLALFSKENVYTNDGHLVLEMKAEEYSCPDWLVDPNWSCVRQYRTGEPYKHTSGYVESKGNYDVKYGFVEAKIQFPYQRAFWPAFWTYAGESVKQPINAAEIDIAEQLGPLGSKTMTVNIHKEYCWENRDTYAQGCPEILDYFSKYTAKKYDWSDWHTYGLEWTSKKLKFYLDGKRIRTIRKHGIEDAVRLIFNFGIWPENEVVDDTLLPQKMLVDYVQVYKSKQES